MKIYTKRGDQGLTDLFGGGRVLKNCDRVKAYGAIDAANSTIGLAFSAQDSPASLKARLVDIMKLLFCAGAEVATAPRASAQDILQRSLENRIEQSHIEAIERDIDEVELELEPLKSFILPCGSDVSARLHMARTAVRYAESCLVDLKERGEDVRPIIIQFFNRLSDYLFVLARLANKEASVGDILWSGKL